MDIGLIQKKQQNLEYWATKILKEYMIKGFALNDDLLKRAGKVSHEEALNHVKKEYDKYKNKNCIKAE